ncbi:hypothetical protein ACFQ1E_20775 [Sphingomonas canadensis]|uniref:Uncharacterized protein n=1 Tax=Sphingomonas canadensis TaxID=1219257 RepID=A0ABW3HEB2_9SPHN|nr:hypothetical protein [Sphingomonas canadensis]MCW3838477.1 hypothetical protein [Sphingomonas canadensis]
METSAFRLSFMGAAIAAAALALLHFTSRDPNSPMSEHDIGSVLGCYRAGNDLVRIDRHALTVDIDGRVFETNRLSFSYGRHISVSSNVFVRYDELRSRLTFEILDRDVSLFVRGRPDDRYLKFAGLRMTRQSC